MAAMGLPALDFPWRRQPSPKVPVPPWTAKRPHFVHELIARLDRYCLIRVNGTPASGKTTMLNLVANELLARHPTTPIYILDGWEEARVERAGGWTLYLKALIGVPEPMECALQVLRARRCGEDRPVRPLRHGRRRRPSTIQDHPMMTFLPHQQISLRPDEAIDPEWKPIGLLLEESEANDILPRFLPTVIPESEQLLTDELNHGLFLTSGGHAGLFTSLIHVLRAIPSRRPLDWKTACDGLFGDGALFFELLRTTIFSRGLPRQRMMQNSAYATVLKHAIACDGTTRSSFPSDLNEERALEDIWRNGWLHAEQMEGGETYYMFPTQVHRCSSSSQTTPEKNSSISPLSRMAVDAIRRFHPNQLCDTPALPIEAQCQQEFYRYLFPLLIERHITIAPESLIKTGIRSGRMDFLVPQKQWGVDLLRSGDRIQQHMQRFKHKGPYFPLLRDKLIQEYIVLNFTRTPPRKRYPAYRGHLYHVVFSEDFRSVRVVDASDLSEVITLVLAENAFFFR
ncbi:uncharacterized protein BO66DRAFT_436731 [Aspergillus aculeatinus CBS 121060]|uniref:Uncharacterized protein n=1 Tax=Aspergillus aculeatinus CBS 121060 TaxID=1448322 RepID=A0ACD1HEB6_9EURO|nr:hypothetical protein BO66DRAFT_436731 [Aspergillus aculeatinus CBS 121060]RAH71854.1 hypothetical protein BO66DRAFT_436731 [Aspergillus aculeatinus CBS 121060]